MDLEKYTDRSRGFIQSAQGLALRSGHQRFTPEHVLKVLLDDEEGLAAGLIRAAGGRPDQALTGVETALSKMPKVEGSGAGQLYLAPETARLFEQAEQLAKKSGDSFVTAERLLLAIALTPGSEAEKFSRPPASPHRRSMPPSKPCARAAPPTARRPRTPMTP